MAKPITERIAVYIDFDNIVVSRYNQLHGKGAFQKDKVRNHNSRFSSADPEVSTRIQQATVDVGAVLDYASSFGIIVISRAYADWSATVNSDYQKQLIGRAVDLTQLFPATAGLKNGADIRLAVDVVEDIFRLDDLTHIVIVAGDSDYIPLAQRAKRLGRYVVGIGVSGSTSSSLAAACDEFADYDALPGIDLLPGLLPSNPATATPAAAPASPAGKAQPATTQPAEPVDGEGPASPKERRAATELLRRALDLLAKNDQEWQFASEVKLQMKRMDPSFQERTLGYRQFSEFLKSRHNIVEVDQKNPTPLRLRLRG